MILILIFAFAAASAEQCCLLKQWEGTLQQMIGQVVSGSPSLTKVTTQMSFDIEKRNMSAYKGSGSSSGSDFTIEAYVDYNTGKTYNVLNGKCTEMPNAVPYIGNCIDESRCVSTGYIGIGQGKRAVKTCQIVAGAFTIDLMVDATGTDCIVIDQAVYAENQLQAQRFINVTAGIKDESVFNIPAICDHIKS